MGHPSRRCPPGFTDAGLRTGAEYFYLIVTVYRAPNGRNRHSAGWIERAVPEQAPEAVTDLTARVRDGSPEIVAAWTPPRIRPGPAGALRLAAVVASRHSSPAR